MPGQSSGSSVPAWALPVVIVAAVVVVGLIAWRSLGKNSSVGEGPPMQVKPGMYDIKTEAAAGRLANGLKGLAAGSEKH